jgi:hypothetical protein
LGNQAGADMVDSQIRDELVKQLSQLPVGLQQRVLEFARSLSSPTSTPRGTPGREWLRFAGSISPEDCQAMMDAIEAGCEQVPH